MIIPAPPKPKRPTYRQDWPAYNAAQSNEKAHFQDFLHALAVLLALAILPIPAVTAVGPATDAGNAHADSPWVARAAR